MLTSPTYSIDHETDEVMQRIIRDEFRGRTLIVIAHRLNTIMDLDRVAVLDHGILRELESPKVLMKRESQFRRMANEQGLR